MAIVNSIIGPVPPPARRLILASASPRRRELLAAAGFACVVDAADVDESTRPGEPPEAYVMRVARAKAEVVFARRGRRGEEIVVGADTTVVVDGDVLGKPIDDEDAARMLRRISGRTHEVLTAVAVVWSEGADAALTRTTVEVRALADADIEAYIASGEAIDKAGAYGIQGRASRFVTGIVGSYSNVVGLPMATVDRLLAPLGRLADSD